MAPTRLGTEPRRLIPYPRGLKERGAKTTINPGEGAFYGPKLEYTLRDAIGREWQCGTTQVDFNLPGRFGAFYIAQDSEKTTPVMIHRAVFGSLERFIGVLIEHFAGHLPLWLSPLQIVVATITQRPTITPMSDGGGAQLGLLVEGDLRNEKLPIRCASIRSPRCRSCWFSVEGSGLAHGLDPAPWLTGSDIDGAGRSETASRRGGAADLKRAG